MLGVDKGRKEKRREGKSNAKEVRRFVSAGLGWIGYGMGWNGQARLG
jgi:hypothetical protein